VADIQIPDQVFQTPLHGVQLLPAQGGGLLGIAGECVRTVQLAAPRYFPLPKTKPLWRLQDQGERYTSTIELFDEPARQLLRIECEGSGIFECRNDVINVAWQSEGTGFEHYLQTVGLSLWLEMRGVPCIHANAIATDAGVIGLIAPSRTGKTTLTAALAARGMAMMTDDMMAIHKTAAGWRVFPAWPQLRMWPEVAQHFVKNADSLRRVHSRFEKRVVRLNEQNAPVCSSASYPDMGLGYPNISYSNKSGLLKQLYLLERTDDAQTEIAIEPVTAAESLLALLKNSMLADAYRPLGIEPTRLNALAQLLKVVQVKKVVYPSGKAHLASVCRCIEMDLEGV